MRLRDTIEIFANQFEGLFRVVAIEIGGHGKRSGLAYERRERLLVENLSDGFGGFPIILQLVLGLGAIVVSVIIQDGRLDSGIDGVFGRAFKVALFEVVFCNGDEAGGSMAFGLGGGGFLTTFLRDFLEVR